MKKNLSLLLTLLYLSPAVWADDIQRCHQQAFELGEDQITLGEIRINCQQDPKFYAPNSGQTPEEVAQAQPQPEVISVDDKRKLELMAAENPYGISPHKRNYMMPITYNRRPNGKPLGISDQALDQAEVKFQFSYKVPLMQQLMNLPIDFHFAYTNQSYWQAFNGTSSRPFRETNHEPELFFTWTDLWLPPLVEHAQYSAGISHQSNGRSGDVSRSWNRVFISTLMQHEHYYLGFKLWNRIADKPKKFPGDPRGDDNPDIEKFMGHFELELSRVKQLRSFSVMLRNNLRSGDNYGAIQASYSFPLSKTLRGYFEYFEGYGESMIDYNHNNQRFGVGIAISDWP